jgi:ABC-type nitrate/sulfonate/bicarbonate transport system permease component
MAKAMSVFTKREGAGSIAHSAWLRRTIFYLLLLILWQVIALAGIWPDYLFPGLRASRASSFDTRCWNGR